MRAGAQIIIIIVHVFLFFFAIRSASAYAKDSCAVFVTLNMPQFFS